jgi:hexosaminidase
MKTLCELVDLLVLFKFNQLQLYFEHTFAYSGHKIVWEGADPYHGHEMLALSEYCYHRGIALVPNQNSFGHFHRWLVHDRSDPARAFPCN